MFKFDFASSAEEVADHADDSENDKRAEADRMIANMTERSISSANSCKLLYASSTSTDKVISCVPEHVDLHSSIDGLQYLLASGAIILGHIVKKHISASNTFSSCTTDATAS